MKRQTVTSSNVLSVGYDPDTKVLEVQYLSGGVYRYHGVAAWEWEALMRAPSVGRYMATVIKPRYQVERVPNEPVREGMPAPEPEAPEQPVERRG